MRLAISLLLQIIIFVPSRIRGACVCKYVDGHLLATASSDGIIQVWKIVKNKVLLNLHAKAYKQLLFTRSHLHSFFLCFEQDTWSSVKLLSHDTKFRLTCLAMTQRQDHCESSSVAERVCAEDSCEVSVVSEFSFVCISFINPLMRIDGKTQGFH